MKHRIEVFASADTNSDLERLRQAATETLRLHGPADPRQINIALSADDTVRALNRAHRGIDQTTDVLSFPADPLPEALREGPVCLGDIVIDLAYVSARTRQAEIDLEDALCMLVAHGVLHLLGFDHDTEANRRAMWRAQAAALSQLGIDAGIVARYGAAETGEAGID